MYCENCHRDMEQVVKHVTGLAFVEYYECPACSGKTKPEWC